MPTIDLDDDEHDAVIGVIRRTLVATRYPYSAQNLTLRSALAKLDPASAPKPLPERVPLPAAPTRSRGGRRARR
jgi:hypothetical protein